MKNKLKLALMSCSFFWSLISLALAQQKDFEKLLIAFEKTPSSEQIFVAAHRGDWRNAPENSLLSLKYAIDMGVDIYELDLKKSKDGVLVLMHDRTLDRTVNANGKPSDYTLKELKSFRLKNGLGRTTPHQIPTFEEFLIAAKGQILIDVDKGYEYFPDVINLIKKYEMENQVMVNIDADLPFFEVEKKFGQVPNEIKLMPVINLNQENYQQTIISYKNRKNTIFQCVFKEENKDALTYIKDLQSQGYHIWLNSLWASLNAGHDDDTAVDLQQPDQSWGWLIKQGASVLQTDRPQELLKYLKQQALNH
ncbi:glycerophosphodiester phosphodiesterase family protein [Sphingobacterium sp. SG20118]|uniref:glycerophosphodiester phosphodiesterase family protein n=1 Tax=Sphingobacterium sp. SG20118 TaxID=3367156 RepID=UPI0037DFC2AD